MRIFWRALFWLGDGGWASGHDSSLQNRPVAYNASIADPSGTAFSTGSFQAGSESEAVFRTTETSQPLTASVARTNLSTILYSFSQTLHSSTGEPLVHSLLKRFFFGFPTRDVDAPSAVVLNLTTKAILNGTEALINPQKHQSWLSNISFLRNLTRSPKTNGLIIDVLEGQLITLCVVVAFILIFLIREWVVQQQPGINMQAGPILDPNDRQPEEDGALVLLARQHAQQRLERFRAQQANPAVHENGGLEGENVERAQSNADHEDPRVDPADVATLLLEGRDNVQRPNIARNALDRALTVQLIASEENKGARSWSSFIEIWQRSERNPQEALRLIREEGSSEDNDWMIEVVQRLMEIEASEHKAVPETSSSKYEDGEIDRLSDNSSGSWQDVLRADSRDQSITNSGSSDSAAALIPKEYRPDSSNRDNPVVNTPDVTVGGVEGETVPPSVQVPLEKGKARATEVDDSVQPQPTAVAPLHSDQSTKAGLDSVVLSGAKSHLTTAASGSGSGSPDESTPQDLFAANRSRSARSTLETGRKSIQDPRETGQSPSFNHSADSAAANDNPFHPDYVGSLPDPSSTTASVSQTDRDLQNANTTVERQVTNSAALAPPPPKSVADRVMDWLYQGIVPTETAQNEGHHNDEHVVQDLAAEAPFVPVAHAAAEIDNGPDEGGNLAPNVEVAAAGADAALDPEEPEVIDEVEDFEGVMELIGMRGPILGLIQNGVFSAVLIISTVTGGVWIPYCWGKAVLLLIGDPMLYLVKLPIIAISAAADMVVDVSLLAIGSVTWWVNNSLGWALTPLSWIFPFITKYTYSAKVAALTLSVVKASLDRMAKVLVATGDNFSPTDYRMFSILSHEALRLTQSRISMVIRNSFHLLVTIGEHLCSQASQSWTNEFAYRDSFAKVALLANSLCRACLECTERMVSSASSLLRPNTLRISLDIQRRTTSVDFDLAYWGTNDRLIAVMAGYTCFAVVGALYLKKGSPFTTSENGKKVEGFIIDVLQQAGGVLKVILIISIEMIAFPLYCGLLLDFALLPLFEDATLMSRLSFTASSPWTSAFIHWFVGTCYMFHFALFVSMCRKIMRSGVLCKSTFLKRISQTLTGDFQISFAIQTTQLFTLSARSWSVTFLLSCGRSHLAHWFTALWLLSASEASFGVSFTHVMASFPYTGPRTSRY